jgi:hypothetical protein
MATGAALLNRAPGNCRAGARDRLPVSRSGPGLRAGIPARAVTLQTHHTAHLFEELFTLALVLLAP